MFLTLLPVTKAATTSVSNTPFIAQALTIDQMTGSGSKITRTISSGAAGNFRVDIGNAQLTEFTSTYTVSDSENKIYYGSNGIMTVPFSIYTVSKTTDFATKVTSSYKWVTQLRMIRVSEQSGTWGNFYDMTPGHNENYLGFCDIGIGACLNPLSWGAPTPKESDVAAYRAGTSLSFNYDEYKMVGTEGFIDHYANMKVSANFKPYSSNIANLSGVSIAIDDYQFGSPYVRESTNPVEIGAYDVRFSGTSANNVSAHLEYVHTASDNLLPPEINAIAKAQVLSYQLGTTDFDKAPDGPFTVQQSLTQIPTSGANLVDMSALPKIGEPIVFSMPNVAVRPSITKYVQTARVGTATGVFEVKLNSGIFGPADVTIMPTVTYNNINRICYFYMQNMVSKFFINFPFHLESTVQYSGQLTAAKLLADPNFKQSGINVFLGLGGTTGVALDLTRTPNAADWIDNFGSWLQSSIWSWVIMIAVIAVIAVGIYGFYKIMSRKQ